MGEQVYILSLFLSLPLFFSLSPSSSYPPPLLSHLSGCKTLHVSLVQDVIKESIEISDICVKIDLRSYHTLHTHVHDVDNNYYLVFPFKLHPHLPKLTISAAGWLYVVHYVNVYVIEYYTVTIRSRSNNIIH